MKRYFALILTFSFTALARAEAPSTPPKVLTWQDCVRLAALNNPDLLSARQAAETSRSQYKQSFNGILPKLSLSNSYTDSSAINNIETKYWTAAGNASLDLVDFGQWATIQSASASLRQSQANYQVTAATVLLNLYKAFNALLYAQEEVQVYTHIRDTWKINADMIGLRYKSGSESKGNTLNTKASLLQAQLNLEQSARDIEVAQQQLSQALGMNEFNVLVVTGTWSAAAAPIPHPDFEKIVAQEPQILAQQAVVDQSRAAINLARSTLLPTLSLNYQKGTQGSSEFPKNPYWSFTGTVNYPLFGNGLTSTYYANQAAEHAYEKARLDLRSLHNQTLTSLTSAWSSFAQAQDQIRVQSAFLEADRQRKAEYDILYQSGLLPFQEWIQVVNEYVNFQTSYLRAEQNLILAEAQWRFATGEQLRE